MGEGLLRQRRNLITTCVLLWLLKFGGVTFTGFSIGGVDVEFGNPDALVVAIWLAFWYFLYRYYQYFSSEGIEKLHRVFEAALDKKCAPIIKRIVKDKYPTNNDAILYSYIFLKASEWQYNGHTLGGSYDPNTGTTPRNEAFVLSIRPLALWRGILAAVFDSIFRNSVVTDYLLPFMLALFILYYCGSSDWRGSFLSL